jgi:hypothetical protein
MRNQETFCTGRCREVGTLTPPRRPWQLLVGAGGRQRLRPSRQAWYDSLMSEVLPQTDPDQETERRLLEAAVAEARADRRPSVPHDQVRAEMLREIQRLRSKTAAH